MIRFLILPFLGLMLCPVLRAAPQVPFSGFELHVSAPGPDAIADQVLQKAIDEVAAAGGGTVLLGAGDFKLSRHEDDETVVIKSNVTLRGQGYATHIYLDPTTPPNDLRYFPMRIGTATVPAHNVVIEHLRYTGNDKAIGGGSVMGFNARLDEKESLLLSCDNITVRHCWIYDAKQAAGCTKAATAMYLAKYVIPAEEAKAAAGDARMVRTGYFDADRIAAQFKNWQVYNNYIETCGNKAVELAECNGGLIAGNHIVNVVDGPQVIFGSRNIQIRDNVVHYLKSGINVTEGSHHIRVSGNHVEAMPEVPEKHLAPCLTFRTEPLALHSRIHDVVVAGNIFRKPSCALLFQTRPEALSCIFEGIALTGNVFDGDVHLYDRRTPDRTTIRDIVFADNVCEGMLLSVPNETLSSSHVVVRGNMLRQAGKMTLNASRWIWSGNTHVHGTLEVAASASSNVVRDNVTASPIMDLGRSTLLTGNHVMENSENR